MRIGFRTKPLVFVLYLRRRFSLEISIARRIGFHFDCEPHFQGWVGR